MIPARTILFTALLPLSVQPIKLLAQQKEVLVTAANQKLPDGSVVYRYTVVNNSKTPVFSVVIGFDSETGTKLDVWPRGWAGEPNVPKGSASSPDHWSPIVLRQEES